MTTAIRPTRQALRVHLSHLATTHRAPLVARKATSPTEDTRAARAMASGERDARVRATAFTPMTRDPLTVESPRPQFQRHEA